MASIPDYILFRVSLSTDWVQKGHFASLEQPLTITSGAEPKPPSSCGRSQKSIGTTLAPYTSAVCGRVSGKSSEDEDVVYNRVGHA